MENNNKILIGGAAVALLLMVTKKKPTIKPTTWPSPGDDQSIPVPDGGTAVSGFEIGARPNYQEWIKKDWLAYYKYLVSTNQSTANAILWAKWNDFDNPYRSKFASWEFLAISLLQNNDQIGALITADSSPVYDTWSNWWNNITPWDCGVWRIWFDMNNQKSGAVSARAKFADAWNYTDNWGGYGNFGMGDKCGIDCDFINYFRLKGLDVATFGATSICTLVSIPTNLLDASANASKAIKTASTVIPLAATAAIIYVIYTQSKKY